MASIRTKKPTRLLVAILLGFTLLWWIRPCAAVKLSDRVIEYTLDNGLKILILQRHQSPTVSLYLRFRVGGAEDKGSGLAHLLEHMLFKGTTTIGTKNFEEEQRLLAQIQDLGQSLDKEKKKGTLACAEHIKELEEKLEKLQEQASIYVVKDEMNLLYSENGALGFNAGTSSDLTAYQISLPSNRLELWARLEADRLANPVFREFYSERKVVLEERQQTNESDPFHRLLEQFLAIAYQVHPYRNPIIGWESEIEYLGLEDMERFFRTYYIPNNAVIAAVGDIKVEEFMALANRYFGLLPRRTAPPIIDLKEPDQNGERRVAVHLEAQPRLIIGYHKPTLPSQEDYIFDLVEMILTSGRTSRLYQKLVEKDQVAIQVSASNGMPGARFPNLFTIMATSRHPHTTEEVEQKIYGEIERLSTELVADRELEKVKNQLAGDFIRSLNSNAGLASALSYFACVTGDWKYLDTHLEILDQITPQQIQESVKKYLTPKNRTVAFIVPENQAGQETEPSDNLMNNQSEQP